jgi:hypothetical protein
LNPAARFLGSSTMSITLIDRPLSKKMEAIRKAS